MECSRIRAILSEHADGEIPLELREQVDAHLAACRPCALLFEALKEQSDALGALPRLGAPEKLLENVRSRLEKPSLLSAPRHWMRAFFARKQFLGLAGAVAAAMVLLVTVQVAYREEGSRKVFSSRPPSSLQAPAPSPGSPPLSGARPAGKPEKMRIDRFGPAPPGQSAPAKTFGPRFSPNLYAGAKKAPASPPAGGNSPHGPASAPEKAHAVALVLTLRPVSARSGTQCDLFEAGGLSGSGSLSPPNRALCDNAEQGGKILGKSSPQRILKPEQSLSGEPRREFQTALSELSRLVKRLNGRVLKAPEAGRQNRSAMLLAEVPGANFRLFVAGVRRLGEVRFKGAKEPVPASDTEVRVSISLTRRATGTGSARPKP